MKASVKSTHEINQLMHGVYAHGDLEEAWGYDIFYTDEGHPEQEGIYPVDTDQGSAILFYYIAASGRPRGLLVLLGDFEALQYGVEVYKKRPEHI